MWLEKNLNKCEAYRRGMCLFGCDAVADNFYNSDEALEKNYFEYYLNHKECDALKQCR